MKVIFISSDGWRVSDRPPPIGMPSQAVSSAAEPTFSPSGVKVRITRITAIPENTGQNRQIQS